MLLELKLPYIFHKNRIDCNKYSKATNYYTRDDEMDKKLNNFALLKQLKISKLTARDIS